jgi:hypothetical protein
MFDLQRKGSALPIFMQALSAGREAWLNIGKRGARNAGSYRGFGLFLGTHTLTTFLGPRAALIIGVSVLG